MSMVERPHTATLQSLSDVVVSGIVSGVQRMVGSTYLGQLTVKTGAYAYEHYGIEVDRPGLWMCETADAVFQVGDYIGVNGVTWVVVTDPQVHDADDETAHATQLLRRKEH